MSRRDPGAANGGAVREPVRCQCGRMETLHPIRRGGGRGAFRAAGCTGFQPASNVVELFPGAGLAPAPAGPPARVLDLDAVADRWTDLLDARYRGDTATVRLLEAALADDIPLLCDEVYRLRQARRG